MGVVALLLFAALPALRSAPAVAAGGVVAGRVVDVRGVPVAGAQVSVDFWLATTAADGRYSSPLGIADTGVRTFTVHPAAGDPRYGWTTRVVDLGNGSSPVPDLVLPDASTITGTVTGPNGPVAGATVHLGWREVVFPQPPTTCPLGWLADVLRTTGSDGKFTFANVGLVHCPMWFEPPSGSGLAAEYFADAGPPSAATILTTTGGTTLANIDAVLDPAGTLAGRVVDADTGAPVSNGYIYVAYPDGNSIGAGGGVAAVTASDGTYAVTGLKSGPYDVSFCCGGHVTIRTPVRVSVAAGTTTTVPDLRTPTLPPVTTDVVSPSAIAAGSRVRLRVVGTGFRPDANVDVYVDGNVYFPGQVSVEQVTVVSPTLITAVVDYHPSMSFPSLSVSVSQDDGSNATCTHCITVVTGPDLPQAIAFDRVPPPAVVVGQSFTVAARATTGLDVTLTATGTCAGTGTNTFSVTPTTTGSCTVTATQAGSVAFAPAAPVETTTIAASPPSPTRASGGDLLTTTTPARLLDTRPDGPQSGYTGDKPVAGQTIELAVAGHGGVPNDAGAVVLNVTGTDATAAGYVTVWPCGQPRPLASSLNLSPGVTSPNAVITKLGANGAVCLYTQSGTHLLADLTGWFPTGTAYTATTPARLLDTRPDGPQSGYTGDKPVAGQTIELAVAGHGGVPNDAGAVVLNVTGTDATASGYVTVWPCGQPRPLASSLNLSPGVTSPNAVITKLGANGAVCLYTQSGTHLLADLTGWFPTGTAYTATTPARLLDTRPDGPQSGYTGDKPVAGQTIELAVAGHGGVPNDAGAVVLNVTGTDATAAGYVTVWPCGQPRPLASSLNLSPGVTSPNAVITKLGANGAVCLYTQSGSHLLADLTGYTTS